MKRVPADERAALIARANAAASAVDREFRALHAAGQLQGLSRAYRLHVKAAKAAGRKTRPWWAYADQKRRAMVRAMAREQAGRAKLGHRPPPVPKG